MNALDRLISTKEPKMEKKKANETKSLYPFPLNGKTAALFSAQTPSTPDWRLYSEEVAKCEDREGGERSSGAECSGIRGRAGRRGLCRCHVLDGRGSHDGQHDSEEKSHLHRLHCRVLSRDETQGIEDASRCCCWYVGGIGDGEWRRRRCEVTYIGRVAGVARWPCLRKN